METRLMLIQGGASAPAPAPASARGEAAVDDERAMLESYSRMDHASRMVMHREALRLANGLPPRPIAALLAERARYRMQRR